VNSATFIYTDYRREVSWRCNGSEKLWWKQQYCWPPCNWRQYKTPYQRQQCRYYQML